LLRFAWCVPPLLEEITLGNESKAEECLITSYPTSDVGKCLFAPARPIELPESITSKFLPDKDHARAKRVDWSKMESVQNAFTERYLAEVR